MNLFFPRQPSPTKDGDEIAPAAARRFGMLPLPRADWSRPPRQGVNASVDEAPHNQADDRHRAQANVKRHGDESIHALVLKLQLVVDLPGDFGCRLVFSTDRQVSTRGINWRSLGQ